MFHIILLRCDAVDQGAHIRERLTENRSDLTLQGGPNQHGAHKSRWTTRTNHFPSPPRTTGPPHHHMVSRAQCETTKSKHMQPPFLRDYSTTPGGEMESCTFEVRQYLAYRFRLPPTPGMRLVQFKHDQQGRQRYGP